MNLLSLWERKLFKICHYPEQIHILGWTIRLGFFICFVLFLNSLKYMKYADISCSEACVVEGYRVCVIEYRNSWLERIKWIIKSIVLIFQESDVIIPFINLSSSTVTAVRIFAAATPTGKLFPNLIAPNENLFLVSSTD